MKITLIILVSTFLFTFSGPGLAQSVPSDPSQTHAFLLTDSVFSRPGFTFDIAEPNISADMQSILNRFSNAIAANKQWFLEYRDKYAATGQPLPYDEQFGITREEYRRIQNMEKQPPRLITLSQQKVTVQREGKYIHFKGAGESRILDYLEIDLQQQKIIFAGDTIPYAGEMTANQTSPFGLTRGYIWRLEKADLKSSIQTSQITASVVDIELGLPATGDKTFLRIKYQDIQQGLTRADLNLTGFVH